MSRRRCQLLLDHDLWERLKADADRQGLSVSALVRQRLAGTGGLPADLTAASVGFEAGPSWPTRSAPDEGEPAPVAKTTPLALIEF